MVEIMKVISLFWVINQANIKDDNNPDFDLEQQFEGDSEEVLNLSRTQGNFRSS